MQNRIQELTEELNRANEDYYKNSNNTLSDFEFDAKLRELAQLERQYPQFRLANSPVGRVGSDLDPAFEKTAHTTRMLSIDNSYSIAEVKTWMENVLTLHPTAEFMADLKIDGLSLSLHYDGGMLVKGVTRGDGSIGDNVTENARVIKGVPLEISYQNPVEIRGEA